MQFDSHQVESSDEEWHPSISQPAEKRCKLSDVSRPALDVLDLNRPVKVEAKRLAEKPSPYPLCPQAPLKKSGTVQLTRTLHPHLQSSDPLEHIIHCVAVVPASLIHLNAADNCEKHKCLWSDLAKRPKTVARYFFE